MRHSKFELSSLQNDKRKPGHFKTAFEPPIDILINLDPIEVNTADSFNKNKPNSPLSGVAISEAIRGLEVDDAKDQ